jgi:hypothetical protein
MTLATPETATPPAPANERDVEEGDPKPTPKSFAQFASTFYTENLLGALGLELSIATLWVFGRAVHALDLTLPLALRMSRLILPVGDERAAATLYASQTLGIGLGLMVAAPLPSLGFVEWVLIDLAFFVPLQVCGEAVRVAKGYLHSAEILPPPLVEKSENKTTTAITELAEKKRGRLLASLGVFGFFSGVVVGTTFRRWTLVQDRLLRRLMKGHVDPRTMSWTDALR